MGEVSEVDTDLKFSIIPEWLLDADISHVAVRVYAIIARYADNQTLTAWPSRATIAERAKCTVKSVDRAIAELIQLGALGKELRNDHEGQKSSLYTLKRVKRGATKTTLGGRQKRHRGGDKNDTRTITNELEPKNYIKEFDNFWQSYPKKADKRVAEKAFIKARERATLDTILAGVVCYRDDPNRKPEFTKNPATWLNADAWQNEALAAPAPTNDWGKPLRPPAELPDARAWVKAMHAIGEHWECRAGEFGCR